jgi:hypothetical protein
MQRQLFFWRIHRQVGGSVYSQINDSELEAIPERIEGPLLFVSTGSTNRFSEME